MYFLECYVEEGTNFGEGDEFLGSFVFKAPRYRSFALFGKKKMYRSLRSVLGIENFARTSVNQLNCTCVPVACRYLLLVVYCQCSSLLLCLPRGSWLPPSFPPFFFRFWVDFKNIFIEKRSFYMLVHSLEYRCSSIDSTAKKVLRFDRLRGFYPYPVSFPCISFGRLLSSLLLILRHVCTITQPCSFFFSLCNGVGVGIGGRMFVNRQSTLIRKRISVIRMLVYTVWSKISSLLYNTGCYPCEEQPRKYDILFFLVFMSLFLSVLVKSDDFNRGWKAFVKKKDHKMKKIKNGMG